MKSKDLILLEDSILYDVDAFDVARYIQKVRRLEEAIAQKASQKPVTEKRLIQLASIPPLGTIVPPVRIALSQKMPVFTLPTSLQGKEKLTATTTELITPVNISQIIPSRLKPKNTACKSAKATKKQAVKIVIPSLALPRMQENPFRVLGLPCDASHEQIHERAQQYYRAIRLGLETENVWSLGWMGTVNRNKEDIRNAVGMLSNSRLRLEARIFWFSAAFSQSDLINPSPLEQIYRYTPSKTLVETMAQHTVPIAYATDAALLALLDCHAQKQEFKNPQKWVEAIALWQKGINSELFWQAMIQVEKTSGFEPEASDEDFEAVRGIAFKGFLDNILLKANQLLADEKDASVKAFLFGLQSVGFEEWQKKYIETGILGDLEAQYTQLCDTALSEAYGNNATFRFEVEIEPLLSRLITLFEHNPAKADELKELAVSTALAIISKYNWCNPKESCSSVIRAVKRLASPKSLSRQRLKLLEKQWQKGGN